MRIRTITAVAVGTAMALQTYDLSAAPVDIELISITNSWRWVTNNVDQTGWNHSVYDDSSWNGPDPALLYIEESALPASKNTPLPGNAGGDPLPCYYFRTSFDATNLPDIVSLDFSFLIDDGAVFYLNGVEIQRVRMGPERVVYSTEAVDRPPSGDADEFEFYSLTGNMLTNLVEGANALAVRIHQHGTDSSDAVFGTQVSAVYDPDPQIHLLRGPYLQTATPSSIIIRWRTLLAENSCVVYGSSPAAMTNILMEHERVTEHEVTVTNLQPDTTYFYAIGSGDRLLAGEDGSCSFWTHPPPGENLPLRIWAIGDAGSGYSYQYNVFNAFESMNNGRLVNAWLMLGDNVYYSGTDTEYQTKMFDVYDARLRKTTVWPVLGNHDTYSLDWNGVFPYLNIFSLPAQGESGGVASNTEKYYSFDIGMVHCVCLDSASSSRSKYGAMADWLRSDLHANTNRWTIALFHHPPYSKGSHDSDTEIELIQMRENFVPILEAGGVDLVLSGHSHSYERSYLLDGHVGDSTTLDPSMIRDSGSGSKMTGGTAYIKPGDINGASTGNQGAVYAVVGSSGKLSGGDLDHPAMHLSINKAGSLVMDITRERLDAVFLRDTGETNDWFSIIKPSGVLMAQSQLLSVNADESSRLYLSSSSNPVSFAVHTLPQSGIISDFDKASGAFVYTPAHGNTNSDSFVFYVTDGEVVSYPGTMTLEINPLMDYDKDGMPDTWESDNGVYIPDQDFDGDGMTNLEEYRANTDPRDKNSWLHMTAINRGAGGFKVSWSSVGGVRYRVLYSDGTPAGGFNGVFTPLARAAELEMDTAPPGTPGIMSFTDDFALTGGPSASGSRYFCVQVIN